MGRWVIQHHGRELVVEDLPGGQVRLVLDGAEPLVIDVAAARDLRSNLGAAIGAAEAQS